MFPSDFKKKDNPVEYFCVKILGRMGKMVSSSKSIYRYDHPNNFIVFNANIATKQHGKVWYGDLDLSLEHEKLKELQSKIGDFYIFYESDLRFGKELENIDFNKAIGSYKESGFSLEDSDSSLYLTKSGVPKIKKEKVEEKVDKTPSMFESKENEFEPIEIPDISKLKVKKGHSPWGEFQNQFVKIHGYDKALELYPRLYITKQDSDLIDEMTRKILKKMKVHPAKIEQSIGWESLSLGCGTFEKKVSWEKKGLGYLKKSI